MSAIDSFGGLSSSGSASPSAFGELSSDEFMELILTELQNQDPLEPQDTQALLEQLSSLRDIEADIRTAENFENLVEKSEFAAATNLIGSLISGISTTGQRVADLVISVSISRDGPVLNLFDGSVVPFDQVEEVVGPLNIPDDDGTDGGDDGSDDDDQDGGSGPVGSDIPRTDGLVDPNGSTTADGTGGTLAGGLDSQPAIDPLVDPGLSRYNARPGVGGSGEGDRLQDLIDAHRRAFDARR